MYTRSLQSTVADLEHLAYSRTVQVVLDVSDPLAVARLADARREAEPFTGHPTLSPEAFDELVLGLHVENPALLRAYQAAVGIEE